jgi:hypothetical protein
MQHLPSGHSQLLHAMQGALALNPSQRLSARAMRALIAQDELEQGGLTALNMV